MFDIDSFADGFTDRYAPTSRTNRLTIRADSQRVPRCVCDLRIGIRDAHNNRRAPIEFSLAQLQNMVWRKNCVVSKSYETSRRVVMRSYSLGVSQCFNRTDRVVLL